MRKCFLFLLVFAELSFSTTKGGPANELKINQVQIIASHNSYHLRTEPAILRLLRVLHKLKALPGGLNPDEIDYTNAPLTEQLEKYGLQGLELDVWNDPKGGKFYKRAGRAYVWQRKASGIAALKQPGFKLLHIPDFDFISTNVTFKDALVEIQKWSKADPAHYPLFINVETETDAPGDIAPKIPGLVKAAPFDSAAAEELDAEVKSVFGNNLDGVITPDQVRGNYATLEQAVLAGNWPTIGDAKGKVFFIIDGDGNSGEVYKKGHPSLKGRAMFVYSNPGTPEAAFVIHNGPKEEFAQIVDCVKKGYMVRTRSDGGTWQARNGDYSDMKAAFESGAQIISTDYYRSDPRAGKPGWTDYHVCFEDGKMGRIDPVSAPGEVGK